MAYKSIADARNLSEEELVAEITSAKQKLFQLRLAQTTGRLEKPHEFKHTRRWVAQLLTIQTERQKGIVRNTTSNQSA